ncbi:MAG: hypothetical protein WC926_04745, partial [Candidatus Paceibacterota bacterium]
MEKKSSPKAKPYFELEIRVLKGFKRIARFSFSREANIKECLRRTILSPAAMIRLKKFQIQGRNWQEDDCLSGEKLTVQVWEVAGDS